MADPESKREGTSPKPEKTAGKKMTMEELWETIRELEAALIRVDGKYKMLRRRAHIHRGDITGEQADQLRALLRGHSIDAAEALTLHPEDFFDRNGDLDGGAVLWWINHRSR